MRDLLFKWAIPTYVTTITTAIPVNGQLKIEIGKKLPDQIGLIFGMAIYADTVDEANNPLITTANAQALYINLTDGPTQFFETIRLSDMLNEFAGTPVVKAEKYLPVNIPGNFDLSKSNYINPGLIVSAAPPALPTVIKLELWFVSTAAYVFLMKKGVVDDTYIARYEKSKGV